MKKLTLAVLLLAGLALTGCEKRSADEPQRPQGIMNPTLGTPACGGGDVCR